MPRNLTGHARTVPKRVRTSRPEARNKKGVFWARILGLWLLGVLLAAIVGDLAFPNTQTSVIFLPLIALVWPTILLIVSGRTVIAGLMSPAGRVLLTGFFLSACISCFSSSTPWLSVAYVCLTVVATFTILQFKHLVAVDQYLTAFRWYAVPAIVVVVGFWFVYREPGVRLGLNTGISPNAIALVCISVAIACMSFRRLVVRLGTATLIGMVIYATGSRTAAVAAATGVILFLLVDRRLSLRQRTVFSAAIIFSAVIGMAWYAGPVTTALTEFLLLDDPHRGIESGLSGRTIAWAEAWRLFLSKPLTGVGFRAHEPLMELATSSHNGYLALLAEVGIFGFLFAIALLVLGVWSLLKQYSRSSDRAGLEVLLALTFSYTLLAGAERYFFNVGNPTSLLFMLAIFEGTIPRRLRRHRELSGQWRAAGVPTT